MRWMRRRRRRMQGFRGIPVAGGVPTTLALKYGNRAAGSAYRRLDKRCDARSNGPPTDRTPRIGINFYGLAMPSSHTQDIDGGTCAYMGCLRNRETAQSDFTGVRQEDGDANGEHLDRRTSPQMHELKTQAGFACQRIERMDHLRLRSNTKFHLEDLTALEDNRSDNKTFVTSERKKERKERRNDELPER
uniref:uncharacterized protein LOC127069933 n=1 Tax=Vespula vulgaris TaxID=7454 RepID=UPI00223C1121|nr:uncharacterized protein LOC127069933 [Vespula vulgaris]